MKSIKSNIQLFLKIFICCLVTTLSAFGQVNSNHHWVKGHTKSNGTYVEGYFRTNPNHTKNDNYTTIGNINPFTGAEGALPKGYNYTPKLHSSPTYRTFHNNSDFKYNRDPELMELQEEIRRQEKTRKNTGSYSARDMQNLLKDKGYNVDIEQVKSISINPDGSINVTLFPSDKLQHNKGIRNREEGKDLKESPLFNDDVYSNIISEKSRTRINDISYSKESRSKNLLENERNDRVDSYDYEETNRSSSPKSSESFFSILLTIVASLVFLAFFVASIIK